MFWHLLLSEQREQLGRQLLCCPGRQLIAVFAKARDRRQCRGKNRRQHKRTHDRGADHCYTPDVESFLSECLESVAFVGQTQTRVSQMMPGYANKRSAAFSRVTVMCYRMGGSIGAGTNSLIPWEEAQEEAPCSTSGGATSSLSAARRRPPALADEVIE